MELCQKGVGAIACAILQKIIAVKKRMCHIISLLIVNGSVIIGSILKITSEACAQNGILPECVICVD